MLWKSESDTDLNQWSAKALPLCHSSLAPNKAIYFTKASFFCNKFAADFYGLGVSPPYSVQTTPPFWHVYTAAALPELNRETTFLPKISTAHIVNFVIGLLNYVQKRHRKLSAERNWHEHREITAPPYSTCICASCLPSWSHTSFSRSEPYSEHGDVSFSSMFIT